MSLAKVIEQEADAGHLDGLTPRENDVLDLMAQGLSNAAIATRLHLSVKTVEPVVSSVFLKLGLPSDADSNRRVLAVLEYLSRSARPARP
jgi:DNA-binding NarL/FixJ family response regulator